MTRYTIGACAFLLAMASPANAFVVSPNLGSCRFVPTKATTTVNAPSSSSSLQMNILDRFTRVAKANINSVLKSLEDPEKILNQALTDMQNDLVKVRQSYAEITATQRRLLKQKEQADGVAVEWYERAQLALKAGNDGLAKEALTRRQQSVDAATELQQQIDAQAESIDKLYEGMQALENKIMESKSKKEQMIARARTAKSTQKVNDMLGGITGKTSMDAFSRMEEKVEALEAAAEVSTEMGAVGGPALPGSSESSLEKEFEKLSASSAVDDELARMKQSMMGGGPAASTPMPQAKEVDEELEKLKRNAGL